MRILATLVLLTAASPPATAAEVVRRALIVGANDGGLELEPLRHAQTDAARMAELLGELGGFDQERISVLAQPTRGELLEILASQPAASPEGESLFLFYYSGHADTRGLRLGGEVLSYEELKSGIRAVPADVHLGILDACRSGAITRVKGIKGASVSEPFLDDSTLSAEGEAWIAASAENEDAQESDRLGGSFFTHYLVSGLRGAADTGDGRVSLNEAYSYAYDRTVARTAGTAAGPQHPAYDFRIQGNGDLALTDVRRASAAIVLPEEEAGLITVLRRPDNTPVAEVAKTQGKRLRLALPPGHYLVRRRVGTELREVRVGLTEGSEPVVDRWGFAAQELAVLKGVEPETRRPRRARQEREREQRVPLRAVRERSVSAELVLEEVDLDRDGRPDVYNHYRERTRAPRLLVRKEVDVNRDGALDMVSYFDDQGDLEREEMDRDFDGRFDWVDHYRGGQRAMSEYDTSSDGFPDVFDYYEEGQIAYKERDTDADGTIDYWELYRDGRVVRTARDVDGDGEVDERG